MVSSIFTPFPWWYSEHREIKFNLCMTAGFSNKMVGYWRFTADAVISWFLMLPIHEYHIRMKAININKTYR